MTTLVRSAGSLVGNLLRSPALLVRANRLFKAINTHDVQAVAECIGDGSFFDPLLDEPVSGKAAVGEHLRVLLKAFPDFKVEPDHISVGQRSVSASVTVSGTNLGPIPGKLGFDEVPATGKRISIPACIVLESARGRLHADRSASGRSDPNLREAGRRRARAPRQGAPGPPCRKPQPVLIRRLK